MKKNLLRRGAAWDTLNALVFTALVVVIASFGFRLQSVKHATPDAVARPGTQLLMVDKMSAAERAWAERWYVVQDPTIPARGDADVGFAVVPGTPARLIPLAELPSAVDPPEKAPAMPEAPALATIRPVAKTALRDLPLPVENAPETAVLRQSDGSSLPCPGLFRQIPTGKAMRATVIRTIPVGGGFSRLLLVESCGDAALDSFARQELAKIKFHTGNVITVCWPSFARAK